MIERYISTGPEVKLCQRCKIPFERPSNMKQRNWDDANDCPPHRKTSGKKKPAEPRLGHYIVNNPVIDSFLCGKMRHG